MKKPKTLETKLRSAIRLIWSRSSERRAILKAAHVERADVKGFTCPECDEFWPIQMAEVDHEPPVGELKFDKELYLHDRDNLAHWVYKMFWGEQRAICKLCHKKKTALQRRKRGK